MFTHALHYLKEGLEKNEAVILLADLFTVNMACVMMSNLWGQDSVRYQAENRKISITNISSLNLGFKSVSRELIMPLVIDQSKSELEKQTGGFRIFADLGALFEYGLIKSVMECEYDFHTKKDDNLKIVCGYLQSEIMDLFADLQQCHNNVYVIPSGIG
jgi:hypothetical protein